MDFEGCPSNVYAPSPDNFKACALESPGFIEIPVAVFAIPRPVKMLKRAASLLGLYPDLSTR